ncbi:hypothetical protein DENSPDRAFT_402112 [Dentipellis sp. KUC8613]|nr:hypothetical protein DENSPDRAFT_402112 [Dentipellis sp. KUC8613]
MTEYTTSPEAVAQWMSSRARTANWVTTHANGTNFVSPSVAPSLVSDSDDGLSSPTESDAESSHSVPPRMLLRYPDGRPDIPVTASNPYADNQMQMSMQEKEGRPPVAYGDPWATQYAKPPAPVPPTPHIYQNRARAATHPHAMVSHSSSHQSSQPYTHPYLHSQPPGSAMQLPPPPQLQLAPYSQPVAPETIQIHPSPTTPHSAHTSRSHHSHSHHSQSASNSLRSKSLRSNHSQSSRHATLQMIYAPPPPAHPPMPISPTHTQGTQPKDIVSPSPVHAFAGQAPLAADLEAKVDEAVRVDVSPGPEPPLTHFEQAPPGGSSHSQSLAHRGAISHSHSHSYPPPAASSRHRSGSASHSHSHSHSQSAAYPSSRRGSNSSRHDARQHQHQPPSIVYAPSNHNSETASYNYNPPLITAHRPSHVHQPHASSMQRTASIHPGESSQAYPPSPRDAEPRSRTPRTHHHATRTLAASYSDPTPLASAAAAPAHGATWAGRSRSRGRLYEDFSRTPSPNAGGERRREGQRRRRYDGGRWDDADREDDASSHSSASTYYVIPSPGQKVKVLGPRSNLTSLASSMYRRESHDTGPSRAAAAYEPAPTPSPTQHQHQHQQKRPLLQRLLHVPRFPLSRGHPSAGPEPVPEPALRAREGGHRMRRRQSETVR